MSKIIGITPGPVEFTNLDNEDLAQIKQFNPSNAGSTGQVLTKTANGYDWETTSSGGASNGMVGFYSTFDCETYDNYQGGVPIDPDSTQAGSICINIYYVLQKLDSNNTVIDSSTYDFKASLANNGNTEFEGSVTLTPNNNPDNGVVTFYVRLTPQNQQGTIIFDTNVESWILVKYSATNEGAYKFRVVPLSGGTEAIPQIVSGCANAQY